MLECFCQSIVTFFFLYQLMTKEMTTDTDSEVGEQVAIITDRIYRGSYMSVHVLLNLLNELM